MNHLNQDQGAGALRSPPQSAEAEQAVLGALLLDNAAWDRVGDMLTDADFFAHRHRTIFKAMGALINACKLADIFTVNQALRDANKEEEAGGMPYLNALQSSVASASGIRGYAEIVRGKAVERELIARADEVGAIAYGEGDPSDKLDRAAGLFADLQQKSIRQMPQAAGDLMVRQIDRWNDLASGNTLAGMPTGSAALDAALNGGLRPGKVYVLAARPSVGKSSLAQSILLHCSVNEGRTGLMLSMEMEASECMDRAAANLAGVNYEHLQTGRITDIEWGLLSEAIEKIRQSPLFIDDQAALSLDQIRGKAVALRRENLALIVIDYLQLCNYELTKGQSTNDALTRISKGIKRLAKDLKVPVILLSQLSREVEKRGTPEPLLSDLRDSGAIEQDADVVMMLWRHRVWSDRNVMGLALPKNRQGKAGRRFAFEFYGDTQRWFDSDADISPAKKSISKDKGFDDE